MKKIKYNILKIAVVLGLSVTPFITTSCRQELDINVDANNPSQVSIPSVLSGSQLGLGYILGGEGTRIPASFVQYYAGHRNQPLKYANYDVSSTESENAWVYLYDVLKDMKEVEEKAAASGEQVYVGVSKLLQAYTFSVLTDLYGDIPFTEALQSSKNPTPAYDKQENIYPQLISMIEEGIKLVKSGQGTLSTSADIIYKGDVSKWEKFGNSLKLRLLNHQSKKDGGEAVKAFLGENPLLIESYEDNAQVVFGSTASSANPIYQFDELSGRKDQAVASTIVDKMKDLSDPRVSLYFKPVKNGDKKGQYIGNIPGGDEDDSGELQFSRVGSAYASISSPTMLISAAEVNFIKAEVYQRTGGDAKTAYETAIKQDFLALGLTSGEVDTYLQQVNVAFNGSLERIMEQKWITMFQSPFEAWVDWRRTGFPTLEVAKGTTVRSSEIPRRLPYPNIEINVNGANLTAGPGIPRLYKTYLTRVWWDQ